MKYPRRESNPNLMNRNHLFYSLNYRGFLQSEKRYIAFQTAKVIILFVFSKNQR